MPAVATAGGLPTHLGKYEIMTPLAAGGMARIYIARTTGIGSFERHVVLKMITPERANDHTAVQMFLDEARLAASLNHQNVAQVFEVGQDAGIHYLAMEYVHGQDLRALLAKAGGQGTRVPLELALTVVAGAAAGLHHAHDRRGPDGVSLGIVHRDVSPSNIMIGYDGSVKLLDFGIAKATARSVETQSGIIKGKFAYMAPEQCRGREVDRRSDVFSLGIILYEVTTQHRCFRADSDFDTMHRIVTGDVVRPSRLIQGYPQALESIVMKALAVDASTRYQSAHQLLEALESHAVTSRMSLSTMSLGRFMRDMFGEQPEPWLNQNHQSLPLPPKESTISNTDGTGQPAIRRAPTNLPVEGEHADDAQDPDQPAKTFLELPRPRGEPPREPAASVAEWNAKSYPTAQPLPEQGPPVRPTPPAPQPQSLHVNDASPTQPLPHVVPFSSAMPMGSQPMASVGQFAPYASPGSGHNELSYPRYDSGTLGTETGEPLLKRNLRPVYIGAGIVAGGLAMLLAMTIGDSGGEVKPAADHGSRVPIATGGGNDGSAETPAVMTAAAAPPEGVVDAAVTVVDDSIIVRVLSEPSGAEVLLAGKPIGTTPLDTKVKKGTGQATLTVRRGGYADVQTGIDLTGDFEKTLTLEKLEPTPDGATVNVNLVPKKDPKVVPVKQPRKDPVKDPVKDHRVVPTVKDPKKDPTTPVVPKRPSCQQPGQVDPFDPRPTCKS